MLIGFDVEIGIAVTVRIVGFLTSRVGLRTHCLNPRLATNNNKSEIRAEWAILVLDCVGGEVVCLYCPPCEDIGFDTVE